MGHKLKRVGISVVWRETETLRASSDSRYLELEGLLKAKQLATSLQVTHDPQPGYLVIALHEPKSSRCSVRMGISLNQQSEVLLSEFGPPLGCPSELHSYCPQISHRFCSDKLESDSSQLLLSVIALTNGHVLAHSLYLCDRAVHDPT